MGAMRTHNPRMAPEVHMIVHHVPGHVRRTGIQLGPTSQQAPRTQNTFIDIFYHRFKVKCTNSPAFRERLLYDILHYNSCHLQIAGGIFELCFPYFTFLGQLGVKKIAKKTSKTHITHHFMPLGELFTSLILTTIHVPFEKMSMK